MDAVSRRRRLVSSLQAKPSQADDVASLVLAHLTHLQRRPLPQGLGHIHDEVDPILVAIILDRVLHDGEARASDRARQASE